MNAIAAPLVFIAVLLVVVGRQRYHQLSPFIRRLFWAGLIGVDAIGIARVAIRATRNTLHPPVWDFVLFWINGTIASQGLNFYDPTLATQVAAPFHPDMGFVKEALATPFLYPPPSIVWFVPLGWLEIHTAAGAWYVAHLACLAASVIVLSLTFFEALSTIDVLFTTALVLMVQGTYGNVEHAQTLFLLLLFISLAFRHRDSIRGGMWAALAILVKPFIVVVILFAVLLRKWRPLAGTLATLLAATVLTFMAFGRSVFSSYAAVPLQALPMAFYTEMENQSLLAWILRITHSTTRFPAAYAILGALLGAILLWRLSQVQKRTEAAGFALALTFGLLLYPASLRSYTVVLVLPVMVLYAARLWAPIALACGLTFLGRGDYTILATLVIGITLAVRMPGLPVEASSSPREENFQRQDIPPHDC